MYCKKCRYVNIAGVIIKIGKLMIKNKLLRRHSLKYGLILGVFGGVIATVKAYFTTHYTIAYVLPLTMTLLLLYYIYLYHKKVNSTLLAFLTVSTVFIELLLKEQFTTVGMGVYFWIYIFPLAIFAFFTPIKSLILNIIFISIFIFVHRNGMGTINPDYFLFPLAFSYFSITIFNFIYQKYQNQQADEIEKKTKTLNHLNHSLELRIKKAVQESKDKDKILQQQAKLAQMGELLSMISHQWRQPLGSIAAATISLKTKIALEKYDLSKEEEREEFLIYLSQKLDNIENYTTSLSSTIDDFKNFYNPHKEIVKANILESIKKSLAIMQTSFNRHHIMIKENYHDGVIIEHYPNEIMQVILNILNNALGNFKEKETQDPEIALSIKEEDNAIMIEICDNGGGINEEIMDRIFEPYFSTKDEKNGTGLGLYMSKTIIEEHHKGSLVVSNKNDGACFQIMIPKVISTP